MWLCIEATERYVRHCLVVICANKQEIRTDVFMLFEDLDGDLLLGAKSSADAWDAMFLTTQIVAGEVTISSVWGNLGDQEFQ